MSYLPTDVEAALSRALAAVEVACAKCKGRGRYFSYDSSGHNGGEIPCTICGGVIGGSDGTGRIHPYPEGLDAWYKERGVERLYRYEGYYSDPWPVTDVYTGLMMLAATGNQAAAKVLDDIAQVLAAEGIR